MVSGYFDGEPFWSCLNHSVLVGAVWPLLLCGWLILTVGALVFYGMEQCNTFMGKINETV